MALLNPVEYQTRFKEHCAAISQLLTCPLEPNLVNTFNSNLAHTVAFDRVKATNRDLLDTHVKLWYSWEATLYTQSRQSWLYLPMITRLSLVCPTKV